MPLKEVSEEWHVFMWFGFSFHMLNPLLISLEIGKQFITLANNAYEKWETGVSFNWVKLLYCSIRASICKVVEEVSNSGGVYGSRVLIR